MGSAVDDRPDTVVTPALRPVTRLAPKARGRLGYWRVACCRWCRDTARQAQPDAPWTHDHGDVVCVRSRWREGIERLPEDGGPGP